MRRITVIIKFVLLSVSMVATFASAQTFQLNSDGCSTGWSRPHPAWLQCPTGTRVS
ncbi:MAG: hypothetical protein II822_11335 [Prevotella sp.]|nr:hypothetical protein [Prevotella sp.]